MTKYPNILGITSASPAENHRGGIAVLAAAIALGVSGDLLLREWPWGLNAAAWLTSLCALTLALPRFASLGLPRAGGTGWLCAAAVLSSMLIWRASPVLLTLNLVAVFLCLAMVAFRTAAAAVRSGSITDFASNVAVTVAQVDLGAAVLLARHVDWGALTAHDRRLRVTATGRALAFAAVPVVVFTSLFASADFHFRDLVEQLLFIDLTELMSHLLLVGLFAWLAGGCLWAVLLAERDPVPDVPRAGWLKFEYVETGVVLGLVNVVFLTFVAIQFRYLFGGADRVEASSTLTYAEYARRGFFELVAVAALAAAFLLFAHWLLPRGQVGLQRLFAILAVVLVALVFVVMASALQRMRLYTETFGLTELRLYTTAFMVWLFAVFAWMVLTVLRGRRERFAFGVFVAGLAVVVALNVLNPDGFIVERNAANTGNTGRPFDSEYALSLSADSVPALVANFEKVAEAERCEVGRELRRRYLDVHEDWRSWNWGRAGAQNAVRSSSELAAACDG